MNMVRLNAKDAQELQEVNDLIKNSGYEPTEINVEYFKGNNRFVFGIKSPTSKNPMEVLFDLDNVFGETEYRVTIKSIDSKLTDTDAYTVSKNICRFSK